VNRDLFSMLRALVAEGLGNRSRSAEAEGRRADRETRRLWAHELLSEALNQEAVRATREGRQPLSPGEEEAIVQAVMDDLFGLGRLQRWLEDESVETINVNGAERVFVRYADGNTEMVGPVADSNEELVDLPARPSTS
jgi:pilus assembly protein CpaF